MLYRCLPLLLILSPLAMGQTRGVVGERNLVMNSLQHLQPRPKRVRGLKGDKKARTSGKKSNKVLDETQDSILVEYTGTNPEPQNSAFYSAAANDEDDAEKKSDAVEEAKYDTDETTNQDDSDKVTEATEIPENVCNRNITFKTTLLIEHDGEDMDKNAPTLELLELGKKFLELYNEMNKPSKDSDHCDTKYRKVESVEVQAMGSFERVFADNTRDFRRIHLYHVTASCQGLDCDKHTTLFDKEESKKKKGGKRDGRNRRLPKGRTIWYADNSDEYETCACSDRKEKRSPTVEEFVSDFGNEVSDLYYANGLSKVKTDATDVTAIYELQEVKCKRNANKGTFATTVYVDYEGDSLDDIHTLNSLKEQLTRSFQHSYNQLANIFCDPLQRKIATVSVKEEKIDERLLRKKKNNKIDKVVDKKTRRRRRLKYKVKGRCKGCPKKTKLFEDTSDAKNRIKRRLVFQNATIPASPALEEFVAIGGLQTLSPVIGRMLEIREDRCYCSRHPQTKRAPTTDEFTFWYDQSEPLAEDVSVTSVVETW